MLVRLLELGKTPPGLGQVAFGFTCVGVLVSEDAPHPPYDVLEVFLGKEQLVPRSIRCSSARVSIQTRYCNAKDSLSSQQLCGDPY